jgi:TldD protein
VKRSRLFSGFVAAALALGLVTLAPPPVSAAEPVRGDAVLTALGAEVKRSVAGLKLEGVDRPYFVAFAVEENEGRTISASFGALQRRTKDRSRTLRTDVRLGGYDLDSSALVSGRNPFMSLYASPRFLVLDDDVMTLRHEVWLAADEAYKEAAERLAQKKGILANRTENDPLPDFTRAEPVLSLGARKPVLELGDAWVSRARKLSAVFREFLKVQDSNVTVQTSTVHRTFVSSEGARVVSPHSSVHLYVRASVQAPDGAVIRKVLAYHETDPARLPSEEKLLVEVRAFATDMTAVAAAPLLDKYVGPVLLAGEAAPSFFADLLGPQLSGRRAPLFAQQLPAASFPESELLPRIGRPILPEFLSVVDDPTVETWNGRSLMASYAVDDEGVAAQAVTLVDKGILKTLLMGRRPRKEIGKSNGHGRTGAFQAPQPQVANLFVTSSRGRTEEELKRELIEKVKAQGLTFGLLIRSLAQTSGGSIDGVYSQSRSPLGPPVLAYKVFPDGREELVRGLTFGDVTLKSLREIVSAGKEGHLVSGSISSGGPISSVVAPSVLFEELELKGESGTKSKPALLSNPFFEKPRPNSYRKAQATAG